MNGAGGTIVQGAESPLSESGGQGSHNVTLDLTAAGRLFLVVLVRAFLHETLARDKCCEQSSCACKCELSGRIHNRGDGRRRHFI
jgi:hypothetical protein